MSDLYKTLGVGRTADQAAIKAAYRKLAKKYHPDLNPGDADVERRFKEVSAAYDVLGDPDKRARYDRGDIDPDGRDRGAGFWRNWNRRGAAGAGPGTGAGAAGAQGARSAGGGARFDESDDDPIDEILRAWRSAKARQGAADTGGPGGGAETGAKAGLRRSPQDLRYRLKVPFGEAVLGIKKRVTLSDGKVVNLTIPPGTEDGTVLRLKGQGKPASGGKSAGDAYLELHIDEHPFYRRDGRDIRLDLPVTLKEAVLGASVTVPTVHGNVSLKIPKGANTGQVMRLRGKGVPEIGAEPAGDQYVTLSVVLPAEPDPALDAFIESWKPAVAGNPRHKLGV